MAFAGSAIGLGNIWRFPYITGEYGGSAFIVVYILATVFVSLPVFVAEVVIGRRSGKNARQAMASLAPGRPFWNALGFLPVFIPLLIASYYSVIGGWSVQYFLDACSMKFVSTPPDAVGGLFGAFITSSWVPVVTHLVFLFLSVAIVALGVQKGIEKFSKVSIPVLFVLIVVIIFYALSLPGSGEGVRYLLKPDFSQVTPKTFAYAMGQSFYSLSLGMGIIITYGSYMKKKESILVSSTATAVSDLGFALLAGLAIMPAVFAAGLEPGAGPGLIFQSIPYTFCKMSAESPFLGTLVSAAFFLTIIVAAMTSCISLIEVGTAYLTERFGLRRPAAAFLLFFLCGGVGVLCSLSFGPLAGFTVAGRNLFDLFDWFASNILLLLMALLSVIFVGFVMKKEDVRDEFTNGGTLQGSSAAFGLFYFLIKWVAPVALALIFITNFIL